MASISNDGHRRVLQSRAFRLALLIAGALCLALPLSEVLGLHGDPDPSMPADPEFGTLPEGLSHANDGAFEGGPTGTAADAGINIAVQPREGDVPTGGAPSPLFGAQPFE